MREIFVILLLLFIFNVGYAGLKAKNVKILTKEEIQALIKKK